MTRVLVIGAGIAGLAAARRLSGQGCEVEVIEAAARAGGTFAKQPLCVVEPEAQELLAGLGLQKPPPTTVVHEELRPTPEPAHESDRWRRLANRWRGSFGAPESKVEPAAMPVAPIELTAGIALVNALAHDLSIRFGWEVLDAKGSAAAATVFYVAPSGERTIEAEAVVLAQPSRKPEPGERRMTVFFEAAHTEPRDQPTALHQTPPAASGAAHVWTLLAERHTTTRIDLSAKGSRQLWDLDDEEVGTSLWDVLPPDLPLTGARPAVHRFVGPGLLSEGDPRQDPRVVRVRSTGPGLARALAAGVEAADRLA